MAEILDKMKTLSVNVLKTKTGTKHGPNNQPQLNNDDKKVVTCFGDQSNHAQQQLLDDDTHLIPVKALPASANVKKLSLSRMPFLSVEDLTDTLTNYGYVHDIGIITDPTSKMFLRSGYAIIEAGSEPFLPPLTHTLPLPSLTNGFWENMPSFCKYCHQDGHISGNCPLRLCYNCNRPGHIAAQCPRPSQRSAPSDRWPLLLLIVPMPDGATICPDSIFSQV
ncbi:unnamed protein product [Absidia cylindrospora]